MGKGNKLGAVDKARMKTKASQLDVACAKGDAEAVAGQTWRKKGVGWWFCETGRVERRLRLIRNAALMHFLRPSWGGATQLPTAILYSFAFFLCGL